MDNFSPIPAGDISHLLGDNNYHPIPVVGVGYLLTGNNNNNTDTNEFEEFLYEYDPVARSYEGLPRSYKTPHTEFPFTKSTKPLSALANKILDKIVRSLAIESEKSGRERVIRNAQSVYQLKLSKLEASRLDTAIGVIRSRVKWYYLTGVNDFPNLPTDEKAELLKVSQETFDQLKRQNDNLIAKEERERIKAKKRAKSDKKSEKSETEQKSPKITKPKIKQVSSKKKTKKSVEHKQSSIISDIIANAPPVQHDGDILYALSDEFPFTSGSEPLSNLASRILDRIIETIVKHSESPNIFATLTPAYAHMRSVLSRNENERVETAIAKIQARVAELNSMMKDRSHILDNDAKIEIVKLSEHEFRDYIQTKTPLFQQFGDTPERGDSDFVQPFQLQQFISNQPVSNATVDHTPERVLKLVDSFIEFQSQIPDESVSNFARSPLELPDITPSDFDHDFSFQPISYGTQLGNNETDPKVRAVNHLLNDTDLKSFMNLISRLLYHSLRIDSPSEHVLTLANRMCQIYLETRSAQVSVSDLKREWREKNGHELNEVNNDIETLKLMVIEMKVDPVRFAKGLGLNDIDFIDSRTSSWLPDTLESKQELRRELDNYIPSLRYMIKFKYEALVSAIVNIIFKVSLISATYLSLDNFIAFTIRTDHLEIPMMGTKPMTTIELTPELIEIRGIDPIYNYLEPICTKLLISMEEIINEDSAPSIMILCDTLEQCYIILYHVLICVAVDKKVIGFLAEKRDRMRIVSKTHFVTGDGQYFSESTKKYFTIAREELPNTVIMPAIQFGNGMHHCNYINVRDLVHHMDHSAEETRTWALKQFENIMAMQPKRARVDGEPITISNLDHETLLELEGWYGTFVTRFNLMHTTNIPPEELHFPLENSVPKVKGRHIDEILKSHFIDQSDLIVDYSVYEMLLKSPRQFITKFNAEL